MSQNRFFWVSLTQPRSQKWLVSQWNLPWSALLIPLSHITLLFCAHTIFLSRKGKIIEKKWVVKTENSTWKDKYFSRFVIWSMMYLPLSPWNPFLSKGINIRNKSQTTNNRLKNFETAKIQKFCVHYNRKWVKATGGVRGHFCMWRLDESSNHRGVNAFYGMKISCRTRKILQFEFSGLHTFL